jgi:hypothetical protein
MVGRSLKKRDGTGSRRPTPKPPRISKTTRKPTKVTKKPVTGTDKENTPPARPDVGTVVPETYEELKYVLDNYAYGDFMVEKAAKIHMEVEKMTQELAKVSDETKELWKSYFDSPEAAKKYNEAAEEYTKIYNERKQLNDSKKQIHDWLKLPEDRPAAKFSYNRSVDDLSNPADTNVENIERVNSVVNKARDWLKERVAKNISLMGASSNFAFQSKAIPDKEKQRSYYTPMKPGDKKGLISISNISNTDVAIHELGHYMEDSSPVIRQAIHAFLNERVGNETPTDLSAKFGVNQFDPGETGRKDNWSDLFDESDETSAYYIGKSYPGGPTEVLSMGIQLMYNDPARFAAKDPEYFKLVSAIMDGSIR